MANCIVHKLKDFIDDDIDKDEKKKITVFLQNHSTLDLYLTEKAPRKKSRQSVSVNITPEDEKTEESKIIPPSQGSECVEERGTDENFNSLSGDYTISVS